MPLNVYSNLSTLQHPAKAPLLLGKGGGGGGARALAADLVVRPRVQLDAQASLGCHVGGMANQRYGSVTAAEAQLARRLCQLRERDMPEPG